ncbi:hypothetical protein [Calothrix sp. PCC 6303]|uniref:hypothetical protein n=1 Tax=Calothrix sp. PCC 6303 TaxID=1170562 RepID=UPI0002A0178B|nr:hypothetical protein [Calothrix sp. PCC 6303]AFZ00615.1 hypothetical protein Cal6303_1572 [Calothrix sp. PCC 6303]
MKSLRFTSLAGVSFFASLSLAGTGILPAQAITNFNFQADYDFVDRLTLFPEKDYLSGKAEGSSKNANFGLNKMDFLGYARISEALPALTNGTSYTFNSDPGVYGIKDVEPGYLTLFGKGKNKLFASFSGSDKVNNQNSTAFTTAQLTITGGEGKFKNASGFGTVSGTVNTNVTPLVNQGRYAIDVSFNVPKSIPNSTNVGGMLLGISGAVFLKKKLYA